MNSDDEYFWPRGLIPGAQSGSRFTLVLVLLLLLHQIFIDEQHSPIYGASSTLPPSCLHFLLLVCLSVVINLSIWSTKDLNSVDLIF